MDTDRDYYAMLGLASTAEVEVIQAVYRALAKKYHPDVYKGDKAEAERIMKDLNEAIEILSDPKLREQYDSTRANTTNSTGDFDETIHESKFSDEEVFEASIEEAFGQGAEFYPDVKQYRGKLARLSHTLSIAYVAHIVERKEFEKAKDIYTALRKEFYTKYFGAAPEILQLAEYLLDDNSAKVSIEKRAKARKLNQAIKVLGQPSDPVTFVRKFMELNGLDEVTIFGVPPRSEFEFVHPDAQKKSSLDTQRNSSGSNLAAFVFVALLFIFLISILLKISGGK